MSNSGEAEMRVPLSVMEQWAAVASIQRNGRADWVEADKRFDWSDPLHELEIPTLDFHLDDGTMRPRRDVLPGELVCQLIGQRLRYPMIVTIGDKHYVLCNLQGGNIMHVGSTFKTLADIGLFIQLVETKHFDLNR